MKEKKIHAELKRINGNIDSISGSLAGKDQIAYGSYVLLLLICILCVSVLYFGTEITGFVTFSESVVKNDNDSISVVSSGVVPIETDLENINSMMLSGTVSGNGKAAVFLVGEGRNYLAYYFEGDASEGVKFSDMCYDTCHIEGISNSNRLLFELEGTTVSIDKIKYMYSRIIDFELEPIRTEIDYNEEKAKVIDIRLTNKENTDYTVLLYVDGPLSSSFSWQGSLVHMTPDVSEKIIPVTVKLPSNLPKGTFVNKISARYVPPDTYDFVGESPVAESFVVINNE